MFIHTSISSMILIKLKLGQSEVLNVSFDGMQQASERNIGEILIDLVFRYKLQPHTSNMHHPGALLAKGLNFTKNIETGNQRHIAVIMQDFMDFLGDKELLCKQYISSLFVCVVCCLSFSHLYLSSFPGTVRRRWGVSKNCQLSYNGSCRSCDI